jgi:ADP-ribosylglycohydrolase
MSRRFEAAAVGTGISRTDSLVGSILGQALGDALGFVVEAQPHGVADAYVTGWLRAGRAGERSHPEFPFGQYSDDTQLARELLCSIRDAGRWDPRSFAERVAALFGQGRDVGSGPGTRTAALRLLAGASWRESGTPPPYAGNGSAMRAGPLGALLAHDPATLRRAAREQSRITHRDSRCAAGAVAVAGAAALASRSGPIDRQELIAALSEWVAEEDETMAAALSGLSQWGELPPPAAAQRLHELRFDPDHLDHRLGISSFVVPSVLWSLYSVLHSPEDYWETVCTAIGAGGDTDTMGAIAGAVSGARLGRGALPPALVARLNDRGRWGAAELTRLAHDCVQCIGAVETQAE